MRRIVSDEDARAGRQGRRTLGVLIGALVLLGVALVGYMMWVGIRSPTAITQDASRAEVTGSTTGQGGASSAQTSGVPSANPAYPAPAVPQANQTPGASGPTSSGR